MTTRSTKTMGHQRNSGGDTVEDHEEQTDGGHDYQGDEPSYVEAGVSFTKNLGDYESLRVWCAFKVPCDEEDRMALYDQLVQEAASQVSEHTRQLLNKSNGKTEESNEDKGGDAEGSTPKRGKRRLRRIAKST